MRYDLVFEGGGAKGIAFVGAYEELVQRGHSYGRLLGTSAGAIAATLVAAGYTPAEIRSALEEREQGKPVFAGFMGEPAPFTEAEVRTSSIRALLRNIDLKFVPGVIEDRLDDMVARLLAKNLRSRHLFAFVERGGWYAADRFVTWLQAKLDSGQWRGAPRQFSKLTLAQHFDMTGVELSLVASDTTDGRLLVLNHNTAPDCPSVWAVRMSMSIPLLWDEVLWQASWGTYLGRDLTDHVIVDGGLLSNFPLELFISTEPHVTALMGPKEATPVLGLLIDESLPIPVSAGDRGVLVEISVKPGEMRTVQRIQRLINTATTAHDKMVIDAFNHLVVRLPAQGYGTTEFEMSDERRAALVEAGREAMRGYLDHPPAVPDGSRDLDGVETAHARSVADRIASRLLDRADSAEETAPADPSVDLQVEVASSPDVARGADDKWALLIGINDYPKLPAEKQLKGCVNDVNAVERVLTSERFDFRPDHIVKLVNAEATRDGILTAFRTHLAENDRVQPDDIVVVYYSGHGSYVKDMNGDEESGYDQTLVPYDAGRGSADEVRDITDDEISLLLDSVSQRTKNINLIFDSCHSGTITRAIQDALEDGAEGLARWVEPWEGDVPLQAGVPAGDGTRDMGPSEWLALNMGYVLIAGCQSDERSREYAFPKGLLPLPRIQHGALTYYLLQALADVGPETTYYDIWDRVRLDVTKKNSAQHPQLEGAFERQVFGGTAHPRRRYVEVVGATPQTVTLAAGLVHGATAGSRFAIYPPGAQSFEDPKARVAMVTLREVDAFTSTGQVEAGDIQLVAIGAPAVEVEHNYVTMQLDVRVAGSEPALVTLRAEIEDSPLLRLVTSDDQPSAVTVRLRYPLQADGSMDTSAGQKLYILSSGDGQSLVEPVSLGENDAPTVLGKLEHIAKYNNILAIRNTDPFGTLKDTVKVRLLKVVGEDKQHQDLLEPVERNEGGEIVLEVGERVYLEIANHSDRDLHVTVLDCSTEWEVKPIFPPAGAIDDVISAGGSRRTNRLKINLPEYQQSPAPDQAIPQETVKVLATTDRIDFRSLWLGAMRDGEKDLASITGGHSSLYNLMELAIGGSENGATRSLEPDADPVVKDWTTAEIVFRITM